jgi:hypothetical protein
MKITVISNTPNPTANQIKKLKIEFSFDLVYSMVEAKQWNSSMVNV